MEQPKFKIGQKVKFKGDNDKEYGEVVSFSYDPQRGYAYKISARELDFQAKEIIEGIKHCREDELVDMTNTNVPQEPTQPNKALDVSDTVSQDNK